MSILSASRITDIPNYFSEWFVNRLEEGRIMMRTPIMIQKPVNRNLVSDVQFNRSLIDCIVFWTKNPMPMFPQMKRLNETGYPYYFQFTITGYGRDMEWNLPEKSKIIRAFKELYHLGNGHIIWRYDPIIFLPEYTIEWHLQTFSAIARELKGYTDRCVISFVDMNSYAISQFRKKMLYNTIPDAENMDAFCRTLAEIADENGMKVVTCAEKADLSACGIRHGSCIDAEYIEQITGYKLEVKKDKGQRSACGCAESIDIGIYSTCNNGCYGQHTGVAGINAEKYDRNSLMLCDRLRADDKVVVREVRSLKATPHVEESGIQLSLF